MRILSSNVKKSGKNLPLGLLFALAYAVRQKPDLKAEIKKSKALDYNYRQVVDGRAGFQLDLLKFSFLLPFALTVHHEADSETKVKNPKALGRAYGVGRLSVPSPMDIELRTIAW